MAEIVKLYSLLFFCACIGLGWAGPPAGKMESSKYEEPKCATVTAASNLLSSWISKIPAWYVPMASAHVYHTWVEKFTNQSSTPDKIPGLCLKLLFLAPAKPNTPYMVVAGGLNKAVGYKCTAKSPHHQACEGVPGSPNYAPGVEFDETLVATDNAHYVMMVQCIRNQLKAWYVMTPTEADLSQDVKKDALALAVKLGFDKKFGSMVTYEKCPKGKV